LLTPKRRARYREWDADELVSAFQENNHAVEPVISMEQALGADGEPHPQLAANGMVATVDDPELGPTTQIGVPIHMFGTPGGIVGPRPRAGEHTRAVFTELGYSP